jgi:hypothetical protein
VVYVDENLKGVLATLEECQTALVQNGDRDTAQLVSVAILELRIKLNRIEDTELKALCDAMLRELDTAPTPASSNQQQAPRPRPQVSLKLVK